MIIGDKNINLLISAETVSICRENSMISYKDDFSKEYKQTALIMARTFGDKSYNFSNNKIINLQKQESKDFNVGEVLDYFKYEKDFLFIKRSKDLSKFNLVDKNCKKLTTFPSLYQFTKNNFYFVENNKIVKFNLKTLEKTEILSLINDCTAFCISDEDENNILIAYSDPSNKVHFVSNGNKRSFHWCANKIVHLCFQDEFLVAVSKSGDVVQFHTKLQRTEPLFKFKGSFLDLKIQNSKIYFLTDSEFLSFDFLSNSINFSEILIPKTNFKLSEIKKFENSEETDIFKIKKQSKIEILNEKTPKNKETKIIGNSFVTYSFHSQVFVVNPINSEVISVFSLESPLNFVSGSHVFSVTQRRSVYIVKIFNLFLDRLVLNKVLELNSKNRMAFSDFYFIEEKLFVQIKNEIFAISKLNLLEYLCKIQNNCILKVIDSKLYCNDDKGIMEVKTGKYLLKQKLIKNFAYFDSKLVFCIENKGIYTDLPERTQMLEIKNVIDIAIYNEFFKILYQDSDSKIKMGTYRKTGNELELVEEESVNNLSYRILPEKMFASNTNLLLKE